MSNDVTVTVEKNDITKFLEDFTDIMFKARTSAAQKGALVLKQGVQESLSGTGIKYNTQSPKYTDTLQDAIRITKPKEDGLVGVHILGTQKTGSGTFRLRFFEHGTKVRYQKSINGKKLKKPRNVGKITKTPFFQAGISSSREQAQKAIEEQLKQQIDKAWNNT